MSLKKFKTIITGIAFSPNLKANVFETLRLGGYLKSKVILVHVGEKTPEKAETLESYFKEFGEIKTGVEVVWKSGAPVNVILQACTDHNADLLIIGAMQRENLVNYYLGSIARKIAKKATCSLLLMTHPMVEAKSCNHIVVNGLEDPKTKHTIITAFEFAHAAGVNKVTVVEEMSNNVINAVDDDASLEKSQLLKKQIVAQEHSRVDAILEDVPEELKSQLIIKKQSIFGTRGYSIGHYATVQGADLVIMNTPEESGFLDKFFPRDIDYILAELPTDVLIVR